MSKLKYNMSLNSMPLIDKALFLFIDKLNRRGKHTNPANIEKNIRNFLKKMSKEFTKYLPSDSTGVDIGAGKGLLSDILKPRKTYNLDTILHKEGYSPQIKSKAEKLPFNNNELDYALFFYALHYFNDREMAFKEADRVVKPGGYIIIMLESLRYPWQERMIQLNEMSMNGIIYGRMEEENRPHNYFRKKEFKNLIESLSLKKISEKPYPPTRFIDRVFKTKKTLYILQKPE